MMRWQYTCKSRHRISTWAPRPMRGTHVSAPSHTSSRAAESGWALQALNCGASASSGAAAIARNAGMGGDHLREEALSSSTLIANGHLPERVTLRVLEEIFARRYRHHDGVVRVPYLLAFVYNLAKLLLDFD